MKVSRRYAERASAVGKAGVELLKAETSILTGELRVTTKTLTTALLWLLLAVFLVFWALAVLVYLGIEVGSLWLPRWLSTVVTLAVLLLSILLTAFLARRSFRRLETPAAIVRRRFDDHHRWWKRRLGRVSDNPEVGGAADAPTESKSS